MTTHEAAKIAGVTPTTIRRWIGANPQRLVAGTRAIDGPPWFIWDIRDDDLDNAIAKRRKPGRPYKTAPVQAEGETRP